ALMATGIGAIAVGLGIGIDYLLRKSGEARERTEELERKNRELSNSYKANQEDVKNLSAQYERLSKTIGSGEYSNEDLQKFFSIRSQLANLMPELVTGEDQYGNKLIGSSEKIKAQIALIEKQIETQEKLDAIKNKQEIEDT